MGLPKWRRPTRRRRPSRSTRTQASALTVLCRRRFPTRSTRSTPPGPPAKPPTGAAPSPDDADSPADAAAATRVSGDPLVRPFEALPELPPDVAEAMELFKLAILAHKVAGWREIARKDLLAVLDSLRQLAVAPAE